MIPTTLQNSGLQQSHKETHGTHIHVQYIIIFKNFDVHVATLQG